MTIYKEAHEGLCTCCGINKKAKGFRYLCKQCWQENAGIVGDDVYSIFTPRDICDD